jgi:hypothetical protein
MVGKDSKKGGKRSPLWQRKGSVPELRNDSIDEERPRNSFLDRFRGRRRSSIPSSTEVPYLTDRSTTPSSDSTGFGSRPRSATERGTVLSLTTDNPEQVDITSYAGPPWPVPDRYRGGPRPPIPRSPLRDNAQDDWSERAQSQRPRAAAEVQNIGGFAPIGAPWRSNSESVRQEIEEEERTITADDLPEGLRAANMPVRRRTSFNTCRSESTRGSVDGQTEEFRRWKYRAMNGYASRDNSSINTDSDFRLASHRSSLVLGPVSESPVEYEAMGQVPLPRSQEWATAPPATDSLHRVHRIKRKPLPLNAIIERSRDQQWQENEPRQGLSQETSRGVLPPSSVSRDPLSQSPSLPASSAPRQAEVTDQYSSRRISPLSLTHDAGRTSPVSRDPSLRGPTQRPREPRMHSDSSLRHHRRQEDDSTKTASSQNSIRRKPNK